MNSAPAADTRSPTPPANLVIESLVIGHFLMGMLFLLVGMVAGLYFAAQLSDWNPFPPLEILSPGRWRMVHTNGVAYGWIANLFLGSLHWVIPRLTLRPVLSKAISWFIFLAWQGIVLATAVGLLLGEAQGVEWGETPWWIDPVAMVGLALVAVNFGAPIWQAKGPMYVTNWYFLAAFIWTFLTYGMGNFLPEYFLCGNNAGAVMGLFIHDLVGLFVTPIGWGLMYYFVPILLKKPMWSHGLSLVGFWGLAFFYPLQGIHHYLYTPIPMFLQYGAVITTIALEFVVTTVVINFFGTIRGKMHVLKDNIPLRWFYIGMVNYFVTCLQCAFQVTLTFQQLIHFTDWVVAHAHLVMFGVFSFWLKGIMVHLFPKLLRRPWASRTLLELDFWLSGAGLAVMFIVLTVAGISEGLSWMNLMPWEHSIKEAMPMWHVRFFTGWVILAGYLCFILNLVLTALSPRPTGGKA